MWLLFTTALAAILLIIPHLYLGWRFKKYISYLFEKNIWQFFPIAVLASFHTLLVAGFIHYFIFGQTNLWQFPELLTYWFWFGFVLTFQWLTWVILFDIEIGRA